MKPVETEPKLVAVTRRRVLLVDDSATFLHAVMEELRKDGYDLLAAGSAEEALSLLKRESVDCILMDLVLPGMDGIAASRIIRLDPRMAAVPLLMFTARFESQTMAEALAAGVDAFCPKASDLGLLRAQVRNLLRRRTTEPEFPAVTLAPASSKAVAEERSLFDQVVAICGLAPVVAATTIARACQRANVDPEILDVDKLTQSLPFIRDALRIFLTEHETRRRMVKIEALTHGGRFATAACGR
ncbi:response regulator [Hyalangium versicolor]|uniref:response regulator n=1 Tax=Hyalangium versicolor TaxID=2861190 RepID=UPI001CCA359E|nr:response regulator [Hyalangium versicolor]